MNFATLYREVFVSLIDAMHRKFDKNAQLANQLKTWEISIHIIEKFLTVAKTVDLPRVFFFYLKVTNEQFKADNRMQNTKIYFSISEHTFLHQTVSATWNGHNGNKLEEKSR